MFFFFFFKKILRVPQRGQHSPSGTVALAHGIRGQEILRHTVAEFWIEEKSKLAQEQQEG